MHVYVLRGAPRSGKSTLTRAFKKMFNDVVVVSADGYWVGPGGLYSYDKDFESEAHCWCFRQFLEALESGREVVVVDNTNSRLEEAAPYMLAGGAFGYRTKLVTVKCSVEKMIERNETSVRGQLPENIIRTMAARIEATSPPHWWKHQEYDEDALREIVKRFNIDPTKSEETSKRELHG